MIGVLLIAGSALFVASLASILIWAPVAAAEAGAAMMRGSFTEPESERDGNDGTIIAHEPPSRSRSH